MTFDELRGYIGHKLVCEQTGDGIYQLRCLDDNKIIVTSKDIPEDKIKDHVGHQVVCVYYGNDYGIWNIAIECEDCNCVIYDTDVAYGTGEYTIYSADMKEKGRAYCDEELSCELEGCNGTQYVVDWENGDTTIVCGKGLRWISETEAVIKE
jgi:hypothetical protein